MSQTKVLRIAQTTFAASVAMDLYSGARLPRGEFEEMGPTGSNRAVQVALYGGTGALTVWATGKLWKQGKAQKVLAIALLAGGAGAHGWATSHNWRLR